jgi:hypothetical protein
LARSRYASLSGEIMSTGQAVGGVVGAAVGFVASGFNPAGAMYGAQIGMMAGGYLDPPKGPTIEGPRLSDLAVQTSTYGTFIPRTYGTVGINGNVFWLENNKLKEVVKKKKSGGKGGGGGATTKTYTYFATLAVGLCEGPVDGIRRIWAGPTLIYDAGSGDIDSIIASNATKQANFSFYLGDAAQLPDSRMQADLGAANTPAYRGLCYVVIKDFALAKYGNAIPAFKFEVVKRSSDAPFRLSESIIDVWGVYNDNFVGGLPLDDRSMAHYCYYPARYGNVYHVSVKPDGSRSVVEIPIEKTTPNAPFGCQPITQSLTKSHFAFRSNAYTADGSSVTWGKDGNFKVYRYPAYSTTIPWGFAESDDYVYILDGTLAAGWHCFQVLGESLTGYEVTLPAGYNGMMTTWGDQVVFIWPNSAAGQVQIRIYDEQLVFVEAYNITLAGISTSSAYYTAEDYGCAVSGDIATVCSRSGVLQQVVQVDLGARTASLFNLTAPSIITGPARGAAVNLGGVVAFSSAVSGSDAVCVNTWNLQKQTENGTLLSEIISDECLLTGLLSASDIDVTTLTDSATGYRVAKIGSVRNAIEPLQAIWPFDAIQSGYKIKFRRRGNASVAAITSGDLGMDQQLRQVREMDSQLPNNIVCNYLDRGRNYDANQQAWERPSTGAVNTRSMDVPAVLTATQAAQVIERLGYLYWLERTDFGPFSLPPSFGNLEPSDVVTLTTEYSTYELRLTSVNYKSDGSLECMARLNQASTYTSLAEADDVDDGATVGRDGYSDYLLLDIPVVDETLQNTPGIVAVMCGYTASWPGGTIWRSADAGQTWDDLQAIAAPCTFGRARGVLPAHDGNLIDYGRTLTVDLFAGSLSGIAESQMLNGANIAAYGADGRWEIMRFTNATLNADGSYTISGFWRGDKGTERATGLHVAGDSFVLLDDPDGAFIGMPTELIGVPRYYRGITNAADIDTDDNLILSYAGVNLECLSPVHAAGVRSAGDLAISWKRRTRVGGSWRDNVDATLGEASEAYEIDVMDGATVKRTITATTQTATYTSAQQVTDFGSAQSSILVRIYQISAVVGRGYPLEVTL